MEREERNICEGTEKSEDGELQQLGSPYILNPTLGHMMFIYVYLVTLLPYRSVT